MDPIGLVGPVSPNAGYPIAAIASILNVKLGGDTSYFGEIKNKPFFGEGRESITLFDILTLLLTHHQNKDYPNN